MAAATTYTYAQLEQLWINNGGSKATAPVAAAVAMAESGGRSAVTSSNPDGGTNVGPWQLDTPGGGGAGYTVTQLQDPNVNARAAVAASAGGTNWSTWETYVNGAYKAFLSGGTTPDPNVPTAAALTAASNASASTCLVGFTAPNILGIGGQTVCIVSKAQVRNLTGAALLVSGALIAIVGVILIVGIGLEQSGAKAAAGQIARTIRR